MGLPLIQAGIDVRVIRINVRIDQVLIHKAEDRLIVDRILDGISAQARSVKRLSRPRQVAHHGIGVFREAGRAGKTVPEGGDKECFKGSFRRRRHSPVAFIHDKGDFQGPDPLVFRVFLCQAPVDHDLHLLDCGHDHLSVIVRKLPDQIRHVVRLVNIHDVVFRIGLEIHRGLFIQILPVDQKNGFLNGRDIGQEVARRLVGS